MFLFSLGVLSLVNGTLSAAHGYQDLPAPKSHHFQQQGDVGCPQNQLQRRDNNGRVMGSQKLYFDHVLITALGMKLSACHTLLTDSSTSRLIRESIRKENMFQSPLH